MSRVQGFPPIAARHATILILGSMPGEASLRARQYYAHPQNLFWRLIGELLAVDPAAPYRQRTQALTRSGIALWDVLQSCTRQGSLDSAIDDATLVANDFAAFFRRHPRIAKVCFNGAKAEACFRRHVMPVMPVMPGLSATGRVNHTVVPVPSSLSTPTSSASPRLANWRCSS